ncbi:MAG: ATP synthase F0 subunit B [Desulfobacterales bacterium]
MKRRFARYGWARIAALVCLLLLLPAGAALAAEDGGGWRATYDLVMRWFNFGLLAFIIVKFSRQPLKDFLQGRKYEVSLEIKQIEEQHREAAEQTKQATRQLEESSAQLAELKERIISQGVTSKERIIEEARQQGRNLLVESQRRIEGQILRARQRFRNELVDAAVDRALERLPKTISDTDKKRMVKDFMTSLAVK